MTDNKTQLEMITEQRAEAMEQFETLRDRVAEMQNTLAIQTNTLRGLDQSVVDLGGASILPEDIRNRRRTAGARRTANTSECDSATLEALVSAQGDFLSGPEILSRSAASGHTMTRNQLYDSIRRLEEAGKVGTNGGQRRSKKYRALGSSQTSV